MYLKVTSTSDKKIKKNRIFIKRNHQFSFQSVALSDADAPPPSLFSKLMNSASVDKKPLPKVFSMYPAELRFPTVSRDVGY